MLAACFTPLADPYKIWGDVHTLKLQIGSNTDLTEQLRTTPGVYVGIDCTPGLSM